VSEHEVLEQVVLACQRALADYRAGLLDEDEFRDALQRAGLVLRQASTSEPRRERA
jgi:hypothetical protein